MWYINKTTNTESEQNVANNYKHFCFKASVDQKIDFQKENISNSSQSRGEAGKAVPIRSLENHLNDKDVSLESDKLSDLECGSNHSSVDMMSHSKSMTDDEMLLTQ
jgi:hypothetical protein